MAKKEISPVKEGPSVAPEPGIALETSHRILSDMLDSTGASQVYGKPVKQGEVTVVPAAEVMAYAGFGGGLGYGQEGGEARATGGGEGAGGVGRTLSRPVAVIIATETGVYVEPIYDRTKILLAALTAAGFMTAMVFRMISPNRALKEIKS